MSASSTFFTLVVLYFSLSSGIFATEEGKYPVNGEDSIDWNLAQKRVSMLSQMGFHPFLMPLIMKNRDLLNLSKKQIKAFMDWRNKYRVPLIHAMNQIINERTTFQRIALSPETSEEVLLAKQEEIFRLHKKVLRYQLSCRRNILDTFTPEQWDDFRFLLIENGYELD